MRPPKKSEAELYYLTHGFAVLAESYDPRVMRIAAELLLELARKLEPKT